MTKTNLLAYAVGLADGALVTGVAWWVVSR